MGCLKISYQSRITVIDEKQIFVDFGYEKNARTKSFCSNYYSGGMLMPNRNGGENYRYGMNGMERDDEVKGLGNSYTTLFRQYDPRLMRWLSLDPEMARYPSWSPYVFNFNNPISFTDPDGDDPCSGGDGGKGKRRSKQECKQNFQKKKEKKKPKLKKINSKTVIITTIEKSPAIKGERSRSRAFFSETFDASANDGNYQIEFDAFDIPDKFSVFDAKTGARIGGGNTQAGPQTVAIPAGVKRVRVTVDRGGEDSSYSIRLRSTKLIKTRRVISKVTGKKRRVRTFKSIAKEDDSIGVESVVKKNGKKVKVNGKKIKSKT